VQSLRAVVVFEDSAEKKALDAPRGEPHDATRCRHFR
jgi:hypothetical protein